MKKLFVVISLLISLTITSANAIEVTPEEKITGLYVAYFDRAADQEGLKYWTDKAGEVAREGGDESSVFRTLSAGFATHPTFKSTYDHLNNEEFVSLIYQNALGRDGDGEGITYWTDLLDRGVMSRSDMVATFIELSLTTDLTKENYPNLSDEELAAAQLRQDLITNKVDASLMFTKQLDTFSNVVNNQDPENDPAYLASIKIISEVTENTETVSSVEKFLSDMDDNVEDGEQIAFINTYFPDFPDLIAPVFTSDLNVNVDENTVYVTTLTATDASEPIVFEISTGYDARKFKIDLENQLKFIVAPDFELPDSNQDNPNYVENQYSVRVNALDAVGHSSGRTMTVTVNNTDAPGFTSDANVAITENTTIITTVSAQGEDPEGTIIFSITGGEDQSLFNIDSASGLLSFNTAPDFEAPLDIDKNNVYKVEITATESSASVIQQMEVAVEDLGEASLQIISAVYDDKGTTGTDSLFVYFDRQIDDNSWSAPEFELTGTASTTGATFEYTKDSPYKLTVTNGLSGFIPNTTNINVAINGFTVDGETVQAGTPVTVTAMNIPVAPGDDNFTRDYSTEIVTNNNTRLEWKDDNDTKDLTKTWDEAKAYCLGLGDGWRLPNINELVNLADKNIGIGDDEAISPIFVNTKNYYWSSTTYINDSGSAWYVSFDYGKNDHLTKSNPLNVRCVRGVEQSEKTFIRDSIGIVHDTNSGLLWDDTVRTQGDEDLAWGEAMNYCASSTLGGYKWHLPTFNELLSIVDFSKYKPAIYDKFENTYAEGHWTSTEDANTTANNAWSIRFSGGEGILVDKDLHVNKQFARCVTDAL